jgi:hypothetical protein
MRLLVLLILVLFSSLSLNGQQLPEWYRVYTFEDGVIEMNTSLVTTISNDVTRVRFRWTFDQMEALSGESKLKYKSELEVMELNCSLQRYRSYHLTFYDSAGNIIRIQDSPAYGFTRQLEQAKDFRLLIDKFFMPNHAVAGGLN